MRHGRSRTSKITSKVRTAWSGACADLLLRNGRRRMIMATFMMLSRFTDRGMQDVKQAPERIEAFKKSARALGAEVREVYLAVGAYDTISLISAPDDETMCKIALSVGA